MHEENFESFKIFNFLMINQNILFNAESVFDRDTLLFLWRIVEGKEKDTFSLSQKQRKFLIQKFIESDLSFNEDTPRCILEDCECIRHAIRNDANNINLLSNYISSFSPSIKNEIIEVAKTSNFSIDEHTSDFLKNNFDVMLNSIHHNVYSADFFNWELFGEKDQDRLIQELVQFGYLLHPNSHPFLIDKKEIALISLKDDFDRKEYMDQKLMQDPEVFKFLVLHHFYDASQIKDFSIDKISDREIMNYLFEQMHFYGSYGDIDSLYKERVCDLFNEALHSLPKISTFHKIFDAAVDKNWEDYKNNNPNLYGNIFAKTFSYLRNNDTIFSFERLSFGSEIRRILGEKYFRKLSFQMNEYMRIYHSKEEQKQVKLKQSKDMISKFLILYIAKSREEFKKQKMDECYHFLKPYYKLNLANPNLYDKVSRYYKKKKLIHLVYDKSNITKLAKEYQNKYSIDLDLNVIYYMIYYFVEFGSNYLEETFASSVSKKTYSIYLTYKKCLKLIHRLNNNYIKYDSPLLNSYRQFIQFDEKTRQYIYTGEIFTDEKIALCEKYDYQNKVFHQIKRDLIFKIDEMDLNEKDFTRESLSYFDVDLPFTDDYFTFDFDSFCQTINMKKFIQIILGRVVLGFDPINFLNDASYQKLHEILIDGGVFWLKLLLSKGPILILSDFGLCSSGSMRPFIDNMNRIVSLSNTFQIDISNIRQFMLFQRIIEIVDGKDLVILKPETTLKLSECLLYTDNNSKNVLSTALNLVSHMVSRGDSTVPYTEGKYLDYQYSLYDSLDEEILFAGIYTDSCFKCCGNDNDFLHYCALNKNGFVLKITDYTDNFVAGAAGFRHGNCVFFNQLRTIYDEVKNGVCYSDSVSEKKEIIETFKRACESIVFLSQNNEKEQTPIDYVFVNKCYALKDDSVNEVPDLKYAFSANDPMDITSLNWTLFVNDNLKNLQESEIGSGFHTDYGCYPVLCMASSNLPGAVTDNFNFVDVEPLYQRKRNQVVVTKQLAADLISKINKTKAIYAFLIGKEFELVREEDGDLFAVGDNWYLIYKNHQIIDQCVLLEDRIACIEAKMTEEEISKNTEYFCDEKIKIYQK